MYVTMRIGATVLLSLTLVLLPDPGAAQYGVDKQCQDCNKNPVRNNNVIENIASRVVKLEVCQFKKLVRFVLDNNKSICAQEDLPKVVELVKCFREGRKCSDSSSSDSKSEFSKGSNVNPSTASAKPPTTPLVTTKTTIQNEDQTTLLPTKEPTMPIQTPPPVVHGSDTNNGDSSSHKGEEEHKESDQNEDPDGKMKNMKIAIISLILIVLAMATVGTVLYCRKKNNGDVQAPCGRSISYTHAPSEESIPV
ncbi:uncharacterized protein [Hyperolius riggenbachi]|uniref:uncharacterized protein n=1 Tax=Hyperolius riggenbachi TaxID=752182 RepID=UPI0035A29884